MRIKVFLDDERLTPPGWIRVYSVNEAIEIMKTGEVDVISFDNDLGSYHYDGGDGREAMKWLEEQVLTDQMINPPLMFIHTGNPVARDEMCQARAAIWRKIGREPVLNDEETGWFDEVRDKGYCRPI